MKKIILAVAIILTLSGCSQMAIDAGRDKMKEFDLQDDVTYICYDLINKKECPKDLLQLDINILPIVPGTSRFCFGFSKITPNEQGMHCYYRNWI